MENIAQFLAAIRELGVPEHSTFATVDLYESKQVYKVLPPPRALTPPSSHTLRDRLPPDRPSHSLFLTARLQPGPSAARVAQSKPDKPAE